MDVGRQWFRLLIVIALSLVAYFGWNLFQTFTGATTDFSYAVNEIEPQLIQPQVEDLLNNSEVE